MKKLLWWCAGANIKILEACPTEQAKYQAIGSIVLLNATLAGLAGGYTLYFAFFSYSAFAVLFGGIWGICILSVDRYIVASLVRRKNSGIPFMIAIPQILFAIFIAIIISGPFVVKMFEEEINQQLLEIDSKKIEDRKTDLEKGYRTITQGIQEQVRELKNEISTQEEEIRRLEKKLTEEVQGIRGIPGYGPIASGIAESIELKQRQLEKIIQKLASVEGELEKLRREHLTQKQQTLEEYKLELKSSHGLLERYDVLVQKSQDYPIIKWTMYFTIFLFVMLRCLPIFVKLFAPRGAYEEKLELEEGKVLEEALRKAELEFKQSKNEDMRASQVKEKMLWQTSLKEFLTIGFLTMIVAGVTFVITSNAQYAGSMAIAAFLASGVPAAVDLYRKKQQQIYSNRIERNQKVLLSRIDQDALSLLKKKGGRFDRGESKSQ